MIQTPQLILQPVLPELILAGVAAYLYQVYGEGGSAGGLGFDQDAIPSWLDDTGN